MGASLSSGSEFRAAFADAQKEATQGDRQGHAVLAIQRISHNTVCITFETQRALDLEPGGHITIRSDGGFSRSYTPFLVEDRSFSIAVKRYEGGKVSTFLNDRVKVGDFVTTSAPIAPSLSVKGLTSGTLLLVAGGTGIAPLYSMANCVVHRPSNTTHVVLFACFRNEDEVLLADQLVALQTACSSHFKLYFVLSRPFSATSNDYNGMPVLQGRFQAKHCAGRIEKASTAAICGPPGFGFSVADVIEQCVDIKATDIEIM